MRQAYLTKFDIINEMIQHSNVVRTKKHAYEIFSYLQRENPEEVVAIPRHGKWYTAGFMLRVHLFLNELANKEQIKIFERTVGIRHGEHF